MNSGKPYVTRYLSLHRVTETDLACFVNRVRMNRLEKSLKLVNNIDLKPHLLTERLTEHLLSETNNNNSTTTTTTTTIRNPLTVVQSLEDPP